MKNILKPLIALTLFCLLFTQCTRELDLRPLGVLDDETFYQNESDFDAASLSPYSTILNLYYDQFGQGWYQAILIPDDDITLRNNEANEQEDFLWLPQNGQFTYLWQQCYKGIQRSNVIIDQLPKAKQFADESRKARYEAEAKFIRAYFHFILAVNFGKPPVIDSVITSIPQSRIGSSVPGEIWDLIESDLRFAKQNLPADYDAENTGRATSGAASGMLGKVLLFRAQWESKPELYTAAAAEFNEIIGSGKYTLTTNLADNFSLATENNSESLFEVQFTRGDFNPWLAVDGDDGAAGTGRYIFWRAGCGPANDCAPGANGAGYGILSVTQPLQNEFEPNDPRRVEFIYLDGDDFMGEPFKKDWSVTGSTPAKYIKQDVASGFPPNISQNNDRILRLADVILMLAECKLLGPAGDVPGAAALINQVRHRADPTDAILAPRPSGATKEQMVAFLQHERRIELCFEGHRYDDLVRWQRAGLLNVSDIDFGRTPANQNWSEKNLLKPIPQREIDLNPKLTQNEGY